MRSAAAGLAVMAKGEDGVSRRSREHLVPNTLSRVFFTFSQFPLASPFLFLHPFFRSLAPLMVGKLVRIKGELNGEAGGGGFLSCFSFFSFVFSFSAGSSFFFFLG